MLVAGSGVLTVSLLVGYSYFIQNTAEINTAKLAATVAVWLAYLAVLFLRLTNRIYGKKLAWTSIVLFLFALLSIWPVDASRQTKIASQASIELPQE